MAVVFFGNSDRRGYKETPPDEAWIGGADNIEAFLGFYASTFLEAGPYNAAKHGLALNAGEAAVELRTGDGEEVLSAKGPAVEYLSVRKDDEDVRTWTRATKWIDVERNIPLIFQATAFMESIWDLARARYCGQLPEGGVKFWVEPKFEKIFAGLDISLTTMQMPLLYYRTDPPESQSS